MRQKPRLDCSVSHDARGHDRANQGDIYIRRPKGVGKLIVIMSTRSTRANEYPSQTGPAAGQATRYPVKSANAQADGMNQPSDNLANEPVDKPDVDNRFGRQGNLATAGPNTGTIDPNYGTGATGGLYEHQAPLKQTPLQGQQGYQSQQYPGFQGQQYQQQPGYQGIGAETYGPAGGVGRKTQYADTSSYGEGGVGMAATGADVGTGAHTGHHHGHHGEGYTGTHTGQVPTSARTTSAGATGGVTGASGVGQSGGKATMAEKVKGTIEEVTGKVTNDPERVVVGQQLKAGTHPSQQDNAFSSRR